MAGIDLSPTLGQAALFGPTGIVAPGEYIRAYCAEHDPEDRYPGTVDQAIRAWAREQGYRAA